ncbi:LytR/AlgR family response regulator transcription factor [Maribacter aquivivus]|uniref:LytR/AlgR family response regulator transcription factor n=1 Tax=Maribacter aquivivus TaxID=228958 RepID=UPI002491B687|nr:LytTR family DNA-binding domain-containing protein [Maribacter aquivivus]
MTLLILEDEIPAYQKLLSHLKTFFDDEITSHWARSIVEGKILLASNSYDLILSDIKLLDGISFDLFNEVEVTCPIIFCSAYDDYLFQAFNTNGIAYILKPYTNADFIKALEKYQSLFKQGEYDSKLSSDTFNALKLALQEDQNNYKKRFVIKRPNGIQLLNTSEISMIEASGDFCIAVDQEGKRHPISQTIGSLVQQLPPQKFFRINRSEIVHIEFIEQIESHFKNRLLITVKGCKEKAMTSTSTTSDFRKWLE